VETFGLSNVTSGFVNSLKVQGLLLIRSLKYLCMKDHYFIVHKLEDLSQ